MSASADPARRLYTQHEGDITVVRSGEGRWVVGAGAAFPSLLGEVRSPPDGALFFRSDLDAWYTWDEATASWLVSGAGGGAPTGAEYLTGAASAGLSAERVVTDTATVAWDLATPGQAKANVPDDAITGAKLRNSPAGSVIGRSSSAGDPEDITAALQFQVLGVFGGDIGSGGGLAFAQLGYTEIQGLVGALENTELLAWYLGAR